VLQPGQTWRTGSKEARLVNYWFAKSCDQSASYEGVLVNFDLLNTSGATVFSQFSSGNFTITDNLGNRLPVGGWGDIACDWSIERDADCQDFNFQLGSNEPYRPLANCAAYGGYRDMSSTVATWTDLSNPALTEIDVQVNGLLGIDDAKWVIPIAR